MGEQIYRVQEFRTHIPAWEDVSKKLDREEADKLCQSYRDRAGSIRLYRVRRIDGRPEPPEKELMNNPTVIQSCMMCGKIGLDGVTREEINGQQYQVCTCGSVHFTTRWTREEAEIIQQEYAKQYAAWQKGKQPRRKRSKKQVALA